MASGRAKDLLQVNHPLGYFRASLGRLSSPLIFYGGGVPLTAGLLLALSEASFRERTRTAVPP